MNTLTDEDWDRWEREMRGNKLVEQSSYEERERMKTSEMILQAMSEIASRQFAEAYNTLSAAYDEAKKVEFRNADIYDEIEAEQKRLLKQWQEESC